VKIGMYLIRDAKASAFLAQPIMAPTPGLAERQFVDLLKDNSFFAKHAGDFGMWEVASLDEMTGVVTPCSPREVLTGPTVLSLVKEA